MKIKKLITLIIIASLCFRTFSAVVSDNDGSAFITKSEFDSLKNNFQTQLNEYNISIDSKVDNAIATYLAGIRTTNEEEQALQTITSPFDYPIEIYMDNIEFNVANYNNWVWNSCWKPDYDWNFTFQRSNIFAQASLTYSNFERENNKLNWFYDGKRSGDYFKISEQLNKYRIKLSGSFNLMNTNKTSENNLSAAVFMDQTTKVSEESYKDSGYYYRSNIRNDYVYNFKLKASINSNKPIVEFVDCWGYTSGPSLGNSTKYYQYVSGNTLWVGLTNASSDWITGEIYSDTSKITKMFMYSSTDNKVVSPVAYDKDIYITNKDKQKQDVTVTASSQTYKDNSSAGYTYYIRHVVDPGWCLEPENYGSTSRNWYYKSLIDPKRIIYDYILPISKKSVTNHEMVKGIPLTELPSKNNGEEFRSVKISFDLTRTEAMKNAGVYPSIIFFKEPNAVYKISEVSGNKYYDIATKSTLEKTQKHYKLSDGENVLYITDKNNKNNIDENIVLYYKVLWNTSQDKNCSISKPVITLNIIKEQ